MFEEKFFVIQKRHTTNNGWLNNIHPKASENEARHQAHAFMSTYAYGYDANTDYAAVSVINLYGGVIVPEEVYDASSAPAEEE